MPHQPTNGNQEEPNARPHKMPLLDQIFRIFMYYAMFQFVRNFLNSRVSDKSHSASEHSSSSPIQLKGISNSEKVSCLWPLGSDMDLTVYFTDQASFGNNAGCHVAADHPSALAEFHLSNLIYGSDFSSVPHRKQNITIPLSKAILFNHTNLYAHVCLSRKDEPMKNFFVKSFNLTKHKLRKRKRDEKMLLGDDEESIQNHNEADVFLNLSRTNLESPLYSASKNKTHDQFLLFLKPTLALQIISDLPMFPNRQSVPTPIAKFLDWSTNENTPNQYYPLIYHSEFWIRSDMLVEINGTMDHVDILFSLDSAPMWKWQLMSSMSSTWEQKEASGQDDVGSDMLRKMLLETNPILLAVTVIVSILHTIFDFLAFKNDITFFKGNKSMEGLSLRSMVVNTAFQLVIFLYLADNNTSFMVLASNAVGLLIEIWKISKAINISIFDSQGGLRIQWKEDSSYSNSKTKEYDEIATSHLLYITMPLVSGYGVYSLLYQRHKSWYSWILNTLVGFIYMFGFVMMTPQLFINYKLQSVAHLNWRTLTYKSINTFIDDLFAFVIKMPIMHRLACLRDDVIFFIFLYQRSKYRTDYTRVNEYGQCLAPTEEMMNEARSASDPKSDITVKHPQIMENIVPIRRRGARDK